MLSLAFEGYGSEVKGCATCVPFVHPVVRRPGQVVRDKEGHVPVGAHNFESGICLHAMQLDDILGPDEGQDADLRVPIRGARDQRAVAHLGHKAIRGLFIGWVVGAGKHPNSLGLMTSTTPKRQSSSSATAPSSARSGCCTT